MVASRLAVLILPVCVLAAAVVVLFSVPVAVGFAAFLVLVALFFRGNSDPFMPYLLLIAAVQLGMLLRLPDTGLPFGSVFPLLGAWVVLAMVVNRGWRPAAAGRRLPSGTVPDTLVVATYGFFVVALVMTFGQTWRFSGRPWTTGEILTLVQMFVLAIASAYLISSPRRMLVVAKVTILGGVVASGLALAARFGLFAVAGAGQARTDEGFERVSGTLEDPNYFAFQLLIPLAFALTIALSGSRRRGAVIAYLGASFLLGAGVVSTYSAGALVGLATIVVVVVMLRMRTSLQAGLTAMAVVLVVTLFVAATLPEGYLESVVGKYVQLEGAEVAEWGTGRGAAWTAGMRALTGSPVVGSGFSTPFIQEEVARNTVEASLTQFAPHNMYLAIGVGTGMIGLLLFLAALGSALALSWQNYAAAVDARESPRAREYLTAVACLLAALLVVAAQGLHLDLQLTMYTWILLGAALAQRMWRPA